MERISKIFREREEIERILINQILQREQDIKEEYERRILERIQKEREVKI
ncbi:hypothetical protein DICPUDRAFT_155463 [Dictyostelium purpureum]|uniref:Uncharacterized protein n=1 Tax=Dictyostelium purpureum TaxID=5786 RepID=F0ZU31_DICPU|nr:uncharacterized protein DICPUDRAFT_155463 [Dictyostelium purpureum]EGC32548.1 hypothetical protein DICPUDRAFT_155463 [Dictyostelium purpureum]|eukprot:XP_003290924.1 hypothetical protein DICPUDRAFT_155463 [Dictyostelium purpureum]